MLAFVSQALASLPSAGVVIPTYNRLADLQVVLRALTRQRGSVAAPVEIVVVDDGSTDGTSEWLDLHGADMGLTCIRQANAGPARARNEGAAASRAEVILFLGDDTEPQPGWLAEHLEAHRLSASTPTAVLGYTCFPADRDSPFLRWINEHGAQFGYSLIDRPLEVPFNFFYTSNVSLPRELFASLGGFREDFPAAAWEDIEFAYRAVAAGLRLRYLPRARTIHRHRIRVGSFCRRQRTSGRSAAIFAGLHPELEAFLGVPCVGRVSRWEWFLRLPLRAWVAAGELAHGLAGDRVYRRLMDGCYLEGLAESLRGVRRR
jgi:GT2 family glycosyltransferase